MSRRTRHWLPQLAKRRGVRDAVPLGIEPLGAEPSGSLPRLVTYPKRRFTAHSETQAPQARSAPVTVNLWRR